MIICGMGRVKEIIQSVGAEVRNDNNEPKLAHEHGLESEPARMTNGRWLGPETLSIQLEQTLCLSTTYVRLHQ